MKKSYLTTAFQKTAKNYPAQTETLNVAFDARLSQLRRENADASAEKQRHLESQILPGIAAYETLQMVMPKEQALQTVHGYVEQRAWRLKKIFVRLLHIPGLYRKVPAIFAEQTPKLFGPAAGFAATEIQTTGGVWRIDMTKCPYHDACVQYVRSFATVSATATTLPMTECTRSFSGTAQKRWAEAMTAAISA